MQKWILAPLGAAALLLGACGETDTQRTGTGALGGAATGAVVGGPVGAVVGAGVGAAGGAYRDEIEDKGDQAVGTAADKVEDTAAGATGSNAGSGGSGAAPNADQVRQAQTRLQQIGLYNGPIDGVYGQDTASAVAAYQSRNNLPVTRALDQTTWRSLQSQSGSASGGATTAPRRAQ